MKHYKRILSAIVLAAVSGSAGAASSVEARSLGMGNVRVATADIATAPFANPGMLAYQPSREDFSLIIGVGAYLNDNDNLVDRIDDFQTAYENGQAGDPNEALRALDIAQSMTGDIIAPDASALFSTGFSAEKWAFAVSARTDAVAAGTVITTDPVDPAQYDLVLEGALTSELGVSVARNFKLFGQKAAIGLKPKYVKVDNVYVSESIITVDTGFGDLVNDSTKDLGDYTSLDIGFVMGLTEHTQIGLVATNLVSHKINYIDATGNPATLSFDMQARFGVAYRNQLMTLGADIDLIENDALLTSANFQALKSQFISVGGEFNAFDFMQLRIGAQKNIADGIADAAKDTLYTAGVGLWFGFNLDAAVIMQNDSLGGFLQTGFRF
ncbi:MAG: conjugal transfer protein TraF [Gammaproteobacteria bacterium]|jgi:hypothetical protein